VKLVTKLSTFVFCILSLTVGGALLSIWSVREADSYLRQIDLATRNNIANLELSNHTYQLFKQFGDVLIVGRHDNGEAKIELINLIKADFEKIRSLINQEIELAGFKEAEELTALSELEQEIDQLTSKLYSITQGGGSEDGENDWEQLRLILDSDIDRDFHERIEKALKEEAEDVIEIREAAEKQLYLHQYTSLVYILIAILISITSFLLMRRNLQQRLIALSHGADRISSGDTLYRIAETGRDEISALAQALNQLAARIGSREEALRATNTDLEQSVRDRTSQLEALLKEIRKSEKNRRQLMADVSHELRTPLTVIHGEADIALRGTKNTTEFRESLAIIRDAAKHTARIVDDLLFVARNESGQVHLKLGAADIVEMIYELIKSNNLSGIAITESDSIVLVCDSGRIRQALLILLGNARNYGGDKIVVHIETIGTDCRISIQDNGAGMSDEEKERAFERFFRGSNAAERYSAGAGLGLPVAKSIVEAHSGSIHLHDRPGGGLVVEIMLPVKFKN